MNIDNVDFLVLDHSELLEIIDLFSDDNEYNSKMISNFLGKPIKLIDWNTFQSFDFDIKPAVLKRDNYKFICISSIRVNEYTIYYDEEYYSKSYFITLLLTNNKRSVQLLIEK